MSKFPGRDIINLDSDEEIDDSYPFFNFLDPSPDYRPVLSDPEPDLHSCFIDFFTRESNEVDRTRESISSDSNLCGMDDDIGLGLGAGSGSVSGSVPQVDEVIDFDFSIFDFSGVDAEIAIENNNISVEEEVAMMEPEPPNVEEEEDFSFTLSWADLWQFLLHDIGDDEMDFVFNDSEDDAFVFDDNESVIRGSPPASKKVVEGLPDVVMTLGEGNVVCAICKDDVVVEEKVKRLPCKHYYHGECIVPWLGMRNTCPVCRYELPTDDAEYERSTKRQRRGLVTDLMTE